MESFPFEVLYKVGIENNSGLYVCESNHLTVREVTTANLFLEKLKKFTYTNASYIGTGQQDGIIFYVQSQNEKQLFLNYFLEHLTYTEADGFTYYVNDILKDKEFLKQFKSVLMTIEN